MNRKATGPIGSEKSITVRWLLKILPDDVTKNIAKRLTFLHQACRRYQRDVEK